MLIADYTWRKNISLKDSFITRCLSLGGMSNYKSVLIIQRKFRRQIFEQHKVRVNAKHVTQCLENEKNSVTLRIWRTRHLGRKNSLSRMTQINPSELTSNMILWLDQKGPKSKFVINANSNTFFPIKNTYLAIITPTSLEINNVITA